MTLPLLSRRAFALSAAAALAAPALHAQPAPRFARSLAAARGLGQLHSLCIAQNGQTLLAEAIRGPSPDRAVNVKSVSKTLVASLTGAVIGSGAIPGPDARLGDLAPGLIPNGADPRVADLTVADLLTMQTGLERTSGGNYGAWVSSSDWVADALARPMVGRPGNGMLYSTGSYHILGALLSEVTGDSLLTLARRHLGEPLGVRIDAWTQDPQGRYMGGNNMALSPRAMLAFGEAWRTGGAGPEGRLVPADWVTASWTPRTRSAFSGDDYGYGWFLFTAAGSRVAYARGYGGQMIYVLPGHALTVAVTSDESQPARSEGHAGALKRLLTEVIVPEAMA
ncbi:serine hydrolase domain-containing protein [Frigidibacter mobilis]|uniref:Beta-lactamase n=1 Tax=Frigidibacter mobilis TaxID=1335048 RepID=A0A159YZY0_9RHOB|nr:serine hydrolase [Frigidibacter mobilis]AMY68131.1 beta-lactamase [Frigidibacter mobilis]